MIVELLECHYHDGGGFVVSPHGIASVSDESGDGPKTKRLTQQREEGIGPDVLEEYGSLDRLFAEDGDQIRMSIADLVPADTDRVARWLRGIFKHATVSVLNPSAGRSDDLDGWDVLARYIVMGGADPIIGIGGTQRWMRIQVARVEVPTAERGAVNGEVTIGLSTRTLVLFVVGGVVVTAWPRPNGETTDAGTPGDVLASLEWALRESFSTGSDGQTPGGIANHYVGRVLDRYFEIIRQVDELLERWETAFFGRAVSGATGVALNQARLLSELRQVMAGLRDGVRDIEEFHLRSFNTWQDVGDTPVLATGIRDTLATVNSRLAEQRSLAQETLGLVAGTSVAALLDLARDTDRKTGSLQAAITLITAFLIVPGLVAAVYASGVAVPGGSDAHAKAAWLAGLMLFGAVTTVLSLRLYASEHQRLAGLLAAGAVAVIVLVFLLFARSPVAMPGPV
jgi:hypothetical protein